MSPSLDFAEIGAQRFAAALSAADLLSLLSLADDHAGVPGARLFGDERLTPLLAPEGPLGKIASALLGSGARPVRAVLFDKTAANNWAVAWHQDRTIAVRERVEVEGFGPWSRKAGVQHVEPPFSIIEGMATLRAHLDDCGDDNAPLQIAPGSHRQGRVPAADAAEVALRSGPLSCRALAGDVWAYSTSILHASEPARRPRRRRVLQVDFAADDLPGGLAWAGVG